MPFKRKNPPSLTQERLKELLTYDLPTGRFRWLDTRHNAVKVGALAGSISSMGYRTIRVDGELLLSSALVWLYVTGRLPTGMLDHRDTDTLNDRFDNLRPATSITNGYNRPQMKNNTSGFKGVDLLHNGRWRARIRIDGKSNYLGAFATPEEAYARYCEVGETAHGEFFNKGTI